MLDLDKIVNVSGSKIPIFMSRVSELCLWIEAIQKKGHIYDLSDMEMIGLAYDYSEELASEWFGDYLGKNSSPSWKELERKINDQFGSHSSITGAARTLVSVRQK